MSIFFFFMISLLYKHILILCGRYKTSFTALVYSPVIFPGDDNGIIYIGTTDFFCAMQGKYSREEDFLWGHLLQRNGALKSFGVSVLK